MRIWRIILWTLVAITIVLTIVLITTAKKATADQSPNANISYGATDHFSWNKIFGWADFHETHNVIVSSQKLTGYASSSIGDISLDCATTRNGNICGATNYGVCNGRNGIHQTDGSCTGTDGNGELSGYGWNKTIGWISFNCATTNSCANIDYKVTISGTNGDFTGYAWNSVVGWISFFGQNYKVNTAWRSLSATGSLVSSIFDTQIQPGGAILNSIVWQGSQPAGTHVKFQIAVSNSPNGPWSYKGPGQDQNQYFEGTGANVAIPITGTDRAWVNNQRYLRYKVFLESTENQTVSPIVEDIILNWSQ